LPIFNLVKKLLKPDRSRPQQRVYSRSEHSISRAQISPNALKVLYRLKKAGFRACLVGGCVRDLLLGRELKDFDVATDAHPEQVRELFRNCRLIGRRFRLAHVHFRSEIIEVATFRAAATSESGGDWVREEDTGRVLRDNVYGTIEEDAWRRDFSVNALYYDIADFSVVDYVGGMEDLRHGLLRLIGDPSQRFREDPVRMLRAVRFKTKLGFNLDENCETHIPHLASLLSDVPPARLYDEVIKLFLSGSATQTFEHLRHYQLFAYLFPATEESLAQERQGYPLVFLAKALQNTDHRIQEGKPVAPYFLYAALLWEPVRVAAERLQAEGCAPVIAMQDAVSEILSEQIRHVAIPRRVTLPMREVWTLQPRFEKRSGRRPLRLLAHPRFKAAYDFMLLRSEAGEADPELAAWWTRFYEADEDGRRKMTTGPRRRRRRRSKPRVVGSKEPASS